MKSESVGTCEAIGLGDEIENRFNIVEGNKNSRSLEVYHEKE